MLQDICSVDGRILPASEARVPVDDLAFTYGFGVYEHLKMRERVLYFPEEHVARLHASAAVIGLALPPQEELLGWVRAFAGAIRERSCNLKLMAVGEHVYCFASRPHYLPEKAYAEGVQVITFAGERPFPGAKTLSMLTSYLAHRTAQAAGAYDALLVDREGCIPEGSRTNVFYTDGQTVYTPPAEAVLRGVTREFLIAALREEGIEVVERPLRKEEAVRYALLLTSTSAKVLPVSAVDGHALPRPPNVREILAIHDRALAAYAVGAPVVPPAERPFSGTEDNL